MHDQIISLDSNKKQIKYPNKSIEKLITIDQKAIGKSPKSNPATYTGIYSLLGICSPPHYWRKKKVMTLGDSPLIMKAAGVRSAKEGGPSYRHAFPTRRLFDM